MKGIISMSSKEIERIPVLEKLMHKQIRQGHAASMLHLSIRQIRRLAKRYKRLGPAGVPHQLRGTISHRRIPEKEIESVLEIIRQRYSDFGITLAYEKLTEYHQVTFSRETLRQVMIEAELWRVKKRKYFSIHPLRERRSCEGELIQLDGSPYDWFEGRAPSCSLLVFIDDATGKLKHLKFAKTETTTAYFLATKEYLNLFGKPLAFYLDKHGVFRVNTTKANTASPEDSNGLTQFGRAMRELKIELVFANTPQAKGRVERVNQTLQDRLVKELRLRGISTMKAANKYLPEFIKDFNRRFAVCPKEKADVHRLLLPYENPERILSEQHQRILSKELTCSFENKIYQIKIQRPTYAMRHAPCLIRKNNQGEVTIEYKGKQLEYVILKKQPKAEIITSKQLNFKVDEVFKKQIHYPNKAHLPKPDHPWKRSFLCLSNYQPTSL